MEASDGDMLIADGLMRGDLQHHKHLQSSHLHVDDIVNRQQQAFQSAVCKQAHCVRATKHLTHTMSLFANS